MRSALGTLMLRAGLLSEQQVESAHELTDSRGVRFVDALLELELADEDAIVAFAHSKLMIPHVREAVLRRVGPAPLARVDAELAWRHDVLPVAVDETGNLTLAMSDPTDVRAVNEIAAHSGAYLVRAVAPVRALRDAITQYYGERVSGATATDVPSASTPSGGNGRAGEGTPQSLEPPRPSSRPPSHASWNPPMLDSTQEPVPLSAEALARIHAQLVTATESEDVTRLLLDYLGAGFDRVILFVHSREELRGKDCRGRDLLPEAVRQVRIPSAGPSLFSKCIQEQRPHFGPMPTESTIDSMFAQALGGLRGNVLVLPLQLGAKVPLLVFAHGSRHAVDPRSINELCDAVGVALTRILAMRRRR